MTQRSAQEARNNFAALLEDVLRGEEIEITRYGRVLARVVPAGQPAADLGQFRVAGWNSECDTFTEPTGLTCTHCGQTEVFTYRDDGGADRTESLAVLVGWAREHQCKAAEPTTPETTDPKENGR